MTILMWIVIIFILVCILDAESPEKQKATEDAKVAEAIRNYEIECMLEEYRNKDKTSV